MSPKQKDSATWGGTAPPNPKEIERALQQLESAGVPVKGSILGT